MYETLKNHILHLLQKDQTPRRQTLLEAELGVTSQLRPAFHEALETLCTEGQVIIGPRDLVRLPAVSNEITGIFKANARGFGFIRPEQLDAEKELFIPAKAVGNAMSGDRVVAQIVRKNSQDDQDRLTGKIVRVLNRAHKTVVGTLHQGQNQWQVRPDGGDFLHPIELESVAFREARQGDKVVVRIRHYPSGSQPARGVIIEVLGRIGRYDTEIGAIIQRYDLPDAFDSAGLVEASNARTDFNLRDTQGREDITDVLTVTIDPPDAKDFDDAISLTQDRKGHWVLGVHIADVSHFIPAGSALDRAARLRGNSVYLPGQTLPMLPELLSNDLCSLQPDKPRYTKSVYLTYNKDGHVIARRFANTIIRSDARLTYQQVAEVLKGKTHGLAKGVASLLRDMEILARTIEERRRRGGMLQLAMPETEVVMDKSGNVTGVQPADTSYPHTIIEMFMVEANIAVASLLDRYCIPFIRRIHPAPNTSALRRLSYTLRLLGVTLSRQPRRTSLQVMLDQVCPTPLGIPVHLLVLRSLAKAEYAPVNVGHYALAASKYCHFTSPIRRYADLLVHRALGAYLNGDIERARRMYTFSELTDIGRHITETEQTADEATRDLKTILILSLLEKRIGDELNGIVVSLTGFGAFVHLPDYGVEGLIRREALGPDQWQFDDRSQCLIGRHTGAILRLAQTIRVCVAEVRPSGGQLDLTPAVVLIPKMPRSTPQRGSRRRRSNRSGSGRDRKRR